MLKEEARRPRGDKKAEKKRAETLMTIVVCAIGVSQESCTVAVAYSPDILL